MKLDHIAIITSDFENLTSWYAEKLDFEIIQEWTVEFMPGLRLAYLGRDGFKIEIIGNVPMSKEIGQGENAVENLDTGYNHFAITVKDIEAILKDLKQKEVKAVAPVMKIPQAGIKAAVITDLDGNVIEFIEKID